MRVKRGMSVAGCERAKGAWVRMGHGYGAGVRCAGGHECCELRRPGAGEICCKWLVVPPGRRCAVWAWCPG